MPVKGFKTITIRQDVYAKIETLAKDEHRSIPDEIEHLVENENKNACKKQKRLATQAPEAI